MKKCLNLLMLLVMTLSLASCGGSDKVLKAQIESGKKHCPMSLGMAGKLTSMAYDESNREVKFVITLNKQLTDIKDLQADPESARQAMRLALQKGNMKHLLELMVDADASLNITYKNRGSKDEFTLNFSAPELKEILDNPMSEEETNKLLLQNQINSEKRRLPYRIENGLNVVGIEDNGKSLVYKCEVDEDLYDIDEMGKGKDEMKENMRKMMKDRSMRQQAEVLSSLNKGFEYDYIGKTSGKNVVVAFSSQELAEIVGK
ncbi:MAG: hypothetical protein K2H76_07240 [Muribaculaceae bacterium]|nr:hypothetical protein [Muribaculaceae bacterium]